MANTLSPVDIARGFASEFGIDVDDDIRNLRKLGFLLPRLVQLDTVTESGPVAHVTDKTGADYYAAQIVYDERGNMLTASRSVAVVMPGYRTKFAYWPKQAEAKELTVHRGHGSFIVGTPVGDDPDSDFNTDIYSIDARVTPKITIQPGQFYTFEAASWSPEPLVVSVLSQTDAQGNWGLAETLVEPGVDILDTPDGRIVVPEEFATAEFN